MSRCRAWYLLLVMVLLQGVALANDSDGPLHINPFLQPRTVASTSKTAQSDDGVSMQLRGIMLAGEHSLANIGGKIVGVGDEINGYRLIAVNERGVVLDRDGTRKELGVRPEDGTGNDD